MVFVATCGGFYVVLGFGARAVLAARPAAAQLLSRISGVAMIAVGLLLLEERIHQLLSR
jgi:cytochrome c biogenesis protein CcdA